MSEKIPVLSISHTDATSFSLNTDQSNERVSANSNKSKWKIKHNYLDTCINVKVRLCGSLTELLATKELGYKVMLVNRRTKIFNSF